MGNLKATALESWHKTKQYLLFTILVPTGFIIAGFLVRKLLNGSTTAMSELLSWVQWVLIPALIGLVFVFLWHFFGVGQVLKAMLRLFCLVWKGIFHPKKSGELLTLIDEQQKYPTEWLYPVIEYVDLNRQGLVHNDEDVYVRFKIDSHLLFEIKNYKISMKLHLKLDAEHENESKWYEAKQACLPISQLERHHFVEEKFCLEEEVLLDWIKSFRNGAPLLAMLKIGIVLKEDSNPIYLKHSSWIAPMNDYREG